MHRLQSVLAKSMLLLPESTCSLRCTAPNKSQPEDDWVSLADSTKRTRRKRPQVRHPRKTCSNCGSHKTPQWRCGPEGLETLCNACGVRHGKGLPLICTVPKGSQWLLPGIEPDKPTAPTPLPAEHAPARARQPKAPHPASATGALFTGR